MSTESLEPQVLVVDDQEDVHLLVRLKVERAPRKWVLNSAYSGQEALARVRQGDVSLVLTDVRMPRMDGPCLVDCLRAEGFTGPIILFGSLVDDVTCLGADALVDKVVIIDDLSGLVEHWLSASRDEPQ